MTTRILYDGTAASVERIMEIVGTRGVNNGRGQMGGVCLLPYREEIYQGEYLIADETHWWIERRHPREE